jgi:type I restriction enzyme S subunit
MIKRGQAPSYTDQKSVTVLNQKCIRDGKIQLEFARQTDHNVKPINEWAFLKPEDTLVNSTGVGTLGRVAFAGALDELLTVDSHLTIVRPDKNKIQPSFLGLSLHFREKDIEGLAAGSSGQTELSREALGSLIITIPPLPEQKRIVEIISSMDEVTEQTHIAIEKSRNLRSGLLSDLLSGEHEIPASYDKVMGAA